MPLVQIRRHANAGTELCAREAFDVMCPPTAWRPVYQLGYLTFHLMWSHGYKRISYVEAFQSRARMAWPLPYRETYPNNTHREF